MKINTDNTVAKQKEENSAEDIEMMTELLLQDQMSSILNKVYIETKKTIKFILIEMIKKKNIIKKTII